MEDLMFLGIGSAISSDFQNNCSIYVKNNEILVIDPNELCHKYLVKNNILSKATTKVIIALTHTHADHISGLGGLIWQCAIAFNIKPIIITNSKHFKRTIKTLLRLMGVDKNYYTFSQNNSIKVAGIDVYMVKTHHAKHMECFGIELKDYDGKYYYSGDTNDIEKMKEIICDDAYKKVYLELSHYPKVHIEYNIIKQDSNLNKVVAMHLTKDLLNEIKLDGLIQIAKEQP